MEVNVGKTDRNVRIAVGVFLLFLGLFILKGNALLIIIGLILLVTGFLNFCPAYKLIGMNTATGNTGVVGAAADKAADAGRDAVDGAKEAVSDAADSVGDAASDALDATKGAASKAGDAIDDAVDKVKKD